MCVPAIVESDKPLLDEVTVVSEEHQAPLITREERMEISGKELGVGVSEKPELEGEGEGKQEAIESLTEVATTPDLTVYSDKEPSNKNRCRVRDMETFIEFKLNTAV